MHTRERVIEIKNCARMDFHFPRRSAPISKVVACEISSRFPWTADCPLVPGMPKTILLFSVKHSTASNPFEGTSHTDLQILWLPKQNQHSPAEHAGRAARCAKPFRWRVGFRKRTPPSKRYSAGAAPRRSATVVEELGVACALLRDAVLIAQHTPVPLYDHVHPVVEHQHVLPGNGSDLCSPTKDHIWVVVGGGLCAHLNSPAAIPFQLPIGSLGN